MNGRWADFVYFHVPERSELLLFGMCERDNKLIVSDWNDEKAEIEVLVNNVAEWHLKRSTLNDCMTKALLIPPSPPLAQRCRVDTNT
eukprot:TRINITY_DN1133_c0_g1_i1.p1 TRINITY_DN1133_c0_g1~~TRINITY_DN1133_c0_g1_i1.p1  ORF type:complete len:87 (+),score=3.13 TRINITY_DN1133_c0_g1_i1:355-615(+)